MGNFIARAFVKVQQDKIPQIVKQLNEIGLDNRVEETVNLCEFVVIWGGKFTALLSYEEKRLKNFPYYIDCNLYANGDKDLVVKLFLELSQMRDDTGVGQWFNHDCDRHIFVKAQKESDVCFRMDFSRVSPIELAEAVREGRVKL